MKVGLLYSRVRFEEKLIIQALQERGVEHELIDDREVVFNLTPHVSGAPSGGVPLETARWLQPDSFGFDIVLDRAMEFTRGLYALQILNSWGVRTVNSSAVVALCGDKLLTTAALARANIPSPRTEIAFTPESALEAIEALGYPVVLKPVIGSWGRLVAKLNDREAAEALLEHKSVLGHFLHEIFYIQEYIDKPGRDIRAVVIGDEIVAAIYRASEHWVTNTARGATATPCPVDADLEKIVRDAARAVGGGVLAVDVIEDPQRGYLVNEINPTPEFRGAESATHANIPNKIVDYVLHMAHR
ncbi:MAG: lysine biosynthesis protein LysX [Anaerolineae bacterium]